MHQHYILHYEDLDSIKAKHFQPSQAKHPTHMLLQFLDPYAHFESYVSCYLPLSPWLNLGPSFCLSYYMSLCIV